MKIFITNKNFKIPKTNKYLNENKIKAIKNFSYTILSFCILLVIWKILSLIVNSEIIFPSPEKTFIAFINFLKLKIFYVSILSTIYRGLIGFLISFILGISFGFLAGFNNVFYKIFEPILVTIRSTPVITIILIALIWFKAENVPIFSSFLISFPIICANVIEGIKNIDIKIIQMAKIYKISKKRVFFEIYIPHILPFIVSASSTAFGIGWKVVVAAEVLSQPRIAIGTNLQNAKIYLKINEVFAWTLTAIFLAYLFEKIIRVIEKRIIYWKR